jgi:phage-related protein (TIGR01555 family)
LADNPKSKSLVRAARAAARKTAPPPVTGPKSFVAQDSFQNFALRLGMGTGNATMDGSSYGYNPISRNRALMDYLYRGSWLAGIAVDAVADDMTREGIEWTSGVDAEAAKRMEREFNRWSIWQNLSSTLKWSRLYGGAIAVILIDGQDHSTPMRIETVGPGQFRGLLVLDRWMVEPDLGDLVTELGPDLGLPKFYRVVSDSAALANRRVHHSRVLRFEGVQLPHWQRIAEMLWGMSVLERLYDRLIGFDAATAGVVQLVGKSYIRVVKIKGLRSLIGSGGKMLEKVYEQINQWRLLQGIEGITLLDADDDFETNTSAGFSGVADVLVALGQQISGATQVPLIRLFGQSPTGLNSSGESDLRTYYDGIASQQERTLTDPILTVAKVIARSKKLDIDWSEADFEFRTLWQPTYSDRINTGATATSTIASAFADGIVDQATALRELRSISRETGLWGSITEEMIEQAEMAPPPAPEVMGEGDVDADPEEDQPRTGAATT